MQLEPDILAPDFTPDQAAEIARQIGGGADMLMLMSLGVPTAVAGVLSDQIADCRLAGLAGCSGRAEALIDLGVHRAVAEHLAAVINSVEVN